MVYGNDGRYDTPEMHKYFTPREETGKREEISSNVASPVPASDSTTSAPIHDFGPTIDQIENKIGDAIDDEDNADVCVVRPMGGHVLGPEETNPVSLPVTDDRPEDSTVEPYVRSASGTSPEKLAQLRREFRKISQPSTTDVTHVPEDLRAMYGYCLVNPHASFTIPTLELCRLCERIGRLEADLAAERREAERHLREKAEQLLLLAKEYVVELADAWQRGAISEHDLANTGGEQK